MSPKSPLRNLKIDGMRTSWGVAIVVGVLLVHNLYNDNGANRRLLELLNLWTLVVEKIAWIVNFIFQTFFFDSSSCYCPLPYEEDLCTVGVTDICTKAAFANADETFQLTKQLFWQGCRLLTSAQFALNCRDNAPYRPGVKKCYTKGIRLLDSTRGDCEAGLCCDPSIALCRIEEVMYFMTLGYGIDTANDDRCDNAIAYRYPSADCELLSDGSANEALVCTNLGITMPQYCDVTFAGTNDIIDIIREAKQATDPLNGRLVDFGNGIQFRVAEAVADIALSSPESDSDGIVELVYANLVERGCLSRLGVHLIGHSLGGFMASLLALKLGAEAPSLTVQITTAGEPGLLLHPLTGPAASLPVWNRKVRYITGSVMPRGNSWRYIGFRRYGVYQTYDPVAQLGPDMHYVEAQGVPQQFFACESIEDGSFVYQLRGPEGCAVDRTDVLNPLPGFPHRGGLEQSTILSIVITFFVDLFRIEGDTRRLIDMFTLLTDLSMVEDFIQVIDKHSMTRYILFFNKLTQEGTQCDATGPVRLGGVVDSC